MQFLTNVPDLQKVCQNLDPPKRVACCSHASCCIVVVWGTCTVENLRELGRQRRAPPRHSTAAAAAVRLRGDRSRRLLQSSYVFGKKGFAIEFCLAKFGFWSEEWVVTLAPSSHTTSSSHTQTGFKLYISCSSNYSKTKFASSPGRSPYTPVSNAAPPPRHSPAAAVLWPPPSAQLQQMAAAAAPVLC